MVKFTKKSYLTLGNLAKLVFWSILAYQSRRFAKLLSFFSCQFLWWEVFLREREKIFYTYSGPQSTPICQHCFALPQFTLIKNHFGNLISCAIPSSSGHEKLCQALERLFVVFLHSINIPCTIFKVTRLTILLNLYRMNY